MIKLKWNMRQAPGTRRLYFFHIPKTAGMSLWNLLEARYPPDRVFRAHLLDDLLAASKEELKDYLLFRGHFGLLLEKHVEAPMRQVIVLRDPVARTLSMYGHIWRDDGHFGHRRVREEGYTFSDFIRDPYFQALSYNYHARYLAFHPGPQEFAWQPPVSADQRWVKQATHDLHPLPMSAEELYQTASCTLEKIDVVGTAEELHATSQLLAYKMGWRNTSAPQRLNEGTHSVKLSDISKEDRALLTKGNEIDYLLYEQARKRLNADYLKMVDYLLSH